MKTAFPANRKLLILFAVLLFLLPFHFPSVFCLPENFVNQSSEASEAAFTLQWETLPQAVKNLVDTWDTLCIIEPDNRSTGSWAAYTETGPDYVKIVFDGASDDTVSWAVNHEIGHVVDYVMGRHLNNGWIDNQSQWYTYARTSMSPEFQQIYQLESGSPYIYDYAKSNPTEYFAHSFKLYIEDSAGLKQNCPLTWLYIDNTLILVENIYTEKGTSL